jgi:hypothetical protein
LILDQGSKAGDRKTRTILAMPEPREEVKAG